MAKKKKFADVKIFGATKQQHEKKAMTHLSNLLSNSTPFLPGTRCIGKDPVPHYIEFKNGAVIANSYQQLKGKALNSKKKKHD